MLLRILDELQLEVQALAIHPRITGCYRIGHQCLDVDHVGDLVATLAGVVTPCRRIDLLVGAAGRPSINSECAAAVRKAVSKG